MTVTATLYENEMFENLIVDGERNVRVVRIPKDEAVQVGWPIRATKIGEYLFLRNYLFYRKIVFETINF